MTADRLAEYCLLRRSRVERAELRLRRSEAETERFRVELEELRGEIEADLDKMLSRAMS